MTVLVKIKVKWRIYNVFVAWYNINQIQYINNVPFDATTLEKNGWVQRPVHQYNGYCSALRFPLMPAGSPKATSNLSAISSTIPSEKLWPRIVMANGIPSCVNPAGHETPTISRMLA